MEIEEFTTNMRQALRERLGREPSPLECELEYTRLSREEDLQKVYDFMTPTKGGRELAYIAHGLRLAECIDLIESDDFDFPTMVCGELTKKLKEAYKTYLEQKDLFTKESNDHR